MNRKQIWLIVLLCALLMTALAGCAHVGGGAPETPAPVQQTQQGLIVFSPTPAPEPTPSPSSTPAPEPTESVQPTDDPEETPQQLDEAGRYTSKEDVALYIHTYGHLPSNFVTKKAAREAGWSGGSVEPYFEGCSIGGDVFGNREGLLPKADGRIYYECDIDTVGRDSRGSRRIVFSNDGLIYYTGDHYETFTLLYGEG